MLGKPAETPIDSPAPKSASRSGSLTGSILNSVASIKLKIAVFAPIPRLRVMTATKVKLGRFHNIRAP
jgi:hypothetical protein